MAPGGRPSIFQRMSLPNLTLLDHPLIQHKLTYLRDISTSHRPFRALLYQIAGLMVFEATRTVPTREIGICER